MEKHTEHIKYDKLNPLPDVPTSMTAEELNIHWSRFLDKIPVRGGNKLRELYDSDLKYMTGRNIGYTEELHLRNLKRYLTDRSNLHEQIRAEVLLKFLDEQARNISRGNELSLKQRALIAVHSGDKMKPGNVKASQHFSFYSKRHNRVSPESTHQKTINKIHLFESIVPYLSNERQKVVNEEINTLRSRIKEDF